MQVTKNEKIVKVVQEETYDIKGLSKAEAIAIMLLTGRSCGWIMNKVYHGLHNELAKYSNLSIVDVQTSKESTFDLRDLQEKINSLDKE